MQKYDIVFYGATSFVGQIMTRYMQQHCADNAKVKWAIAGRSGEKLQALRNEIGVSAGDLDIIVADAKDESALKQLCQQTKVVVSTVGPYALYGETLLKTCVAQGTDYCDLTGEPQWIMKMLQRYESVAKVTGARIVHCCGFDSIPSDLGVYYTQQQAKQRLDEHCNQVFMRVKAAKGAASGGTIASMMNLIKEATRDKQLRRLLANPYALCPEDHGFTQRQENLSKPKYDPASENWIAPFIMAAINTRIVHRSNYLLNKDYGENFVYDEAMMMGEGTKGGAYATALSVGLAGFMAAAAFPPSRWVLESFVLPKPGEGPSEEDQKQGFYDIRFFAQTQSGKHLHCIVTGDQDPGYGSTGKMLAQAAMCLALDVSKSEIGGGFWTPASAMGSKLINRLEQHAGLTFSVLEN